MKLDIDCVPVTNHFFWWAMELPYMVSEQLGYSRGHDIGCGQYDVSSL